MKKYILLVLVIVSVSCFSDDSTPTLDDSALGKWQLIEQLLDPGDGSGTFQTVQSQRIIEFFSDGKVTVNGGLCFIHTEIDDSQSGLYEMFSDEATDINHDGVITSELCGNFKIYFDISADGHLILWYPCIEACAQKFIRK